MKRKADNAPEKPKKSTLTKVLYVAASVAALFGVALLICNIMLFKSSITQYVAQGYPVAVVLKQLIPAQLLPGVFEPIALYGGVACLLTAAAIINGKVSCLLSSTNVEWCECNEDAPEEKEEILEAAEVENEPEVIDQTVDKE